PKAPPRMPVAEWGHTDIITRGDTNQPERRTRPEDVDIFNLTVKSDGGGSQPTPAAPPTADESGDASSGTQVRRSTSADDFVAATFGADPAGDPEPPTRSATQSADDFFSSFTVTPKSPSEKKAEEDAAKARAAAAGGTDPFSMKITPKRPGELGDGVSVPPGGSPGTASISRGSAAGESIVIGAIDIDGMDNADRALLRAQQQQLSMLREPPDLDSHGLEFAMRFKPAKGVASEFYDFIEFDDQRLGIIVFDVAGHVGLNVWGDVTMATRAFRIYSRACRTPRELLIKTNSELVPDLMAESSLTVCISVLDLEERTLTVAQSGHPPLLLYNQYRTPVLEPVKPSGMVLGLVAGSKFDDLLEERVIELKTGDVLLWYTEGVINCENPQGQQLGVDSLGMLLQAEARRSPEEFLDYLYEQLDRWRDGGEQTADCTAIVMKVGMPPGLA
ncbi:MAG: PP2C family protein-serine/threonine phosphatase, partial [Planctomycetota bacterium]